MFGGQAAPAAFTSAAELLGAERRVVQKTNIERRGEERTKWRPRFPADLPETARIDAEASHELLLPSVLQFEEKLIIRARAKKLGIPSKGDETTEGKVVTFPVNRRPPEAVTQR